MREAVESSRAQAVIERYTSRMEAFVTHSTDWAYQKITDLCSKVIESDSMEEEIHKFNQNSPKIKAYWIKEDQMSKVAVFPRVAIGRPLLQKDFDSSKGRAILPITVALKSSKNAGFLLFYLSLEDLFESMEALVNGDSSMQIAILKENNEVLLSVNLDRKVDFLNLQKGKFANFLDLLKGRYSRGVISKNETSFIRIYYFYASEINIFSPISFVMCIFLFAVWLLLSFIGCLFFRVEISKLLSVVSRESADYHFYLHEFYEIYTIFNSLWEKSENNKREIAYSIEKNNKLKELNSVYALERITMNAAVDELIAEKEVLLIDKGLLEEKIDYLRRKALKNAE